jgi:RHS repeat-associated protein
VQPKRPSRRLGAKPAGPENSPQTISVKNVTGRIAYVWSAVYVDAMVLRDRDLSGDGSYDERLYVQQDANYNPTSLSDNTGVVVERFLFDPYGVATFLDPNWSVDAGGSDYAWQHLHQGGRHDPLTGLVHFRFRDYSPSRGRWTQQDPAGYVDGANRYHVYLSVPIALCDAYGLTVKLTVHLDNGSIYIELFTDGGAEYSIRDRDNIERGRGKKQPGGAWVEVTQHGGKTISPRSGKAGKNDLALAAAAQSQIDKFQALPSGKQKLGDLRRSISALGLLTLLVVMTDAARANLANIPATDVEEATATIRKYRNGQAQEFEVRQAMADMVQSLFAGLPDEARAAAQKVVWYGDWLE